MTNIPHISLFTEPHTHYHSINLVLAQKRQNCRKACSVSFLFPYEDFKELILKGRPTAIEEIGKDFQTSFKGLRPVKYHRVKKNILASWNVKIMIDTQIKVLELQFIHLNVVKNSTRQVYQPTVHLQVWKEKSCLLHFLCQSLCLCYSLTDVPYHVECNFRQMIIFT